MESWRHGTLSSWCSLHLALVLGWMCFSTFYPAKWGLMHIIFLFCDLFRLIFNFIYWLHLNQTVLVFSFRITWLSLLLSRCGLLLLLLSSYYFLLHLRNIAVKCTIEKCLGTLIDFHISLLNYAEYTTNLLYKHADIFIGEEFLNFKCEFVDLCNTRFNFL